jgi:sugar lactone lactonase YvrE
LVLEVGPVYPNGIGFDGDGRLVWTESGTRRLVRLDADGPTVVHEFPEGHVPDGFAVAADGRFLVATLLSGAVMVVPPDGGQAAALEVGALPTNCILDGRTLVVTAVHDMSGAAGRGTVRALETDAEAPPAARPLL